jgi:hypothetical protein
MDATRTTQSQIKIMQQWQAHTAAVVQADVRRVVENAIIQADGGCVQPLGMLKRIAAMEMVGGVSNWQQELREVLRKYGIV